MVREDEAESGIGGREDDGGRAGRGAVGAGPEDFLITRLDLNRVDSTYRLSVSTKRIRCLPQRPTQTSAPHSSSHTGPLSRDTEPILVEIIHAPTPVPRGRQKPRAL